MYSGPFVSSKRVKIESPLDFVILTADIDVPKFNYVMPFTNDLHVNYSLGRPIVRTESTCVRTVPVKIFVYDLPMVFIITGVESSVLSIITSDLAPRRVAN